MMCRKALELTEQGDWGRDRRRKYMA